jgi:hypothetical protein
MRNFDLKMTWFYPITVVCLFSFLLGFLSPLISSFLGIFLSFWLTIRARLDGVLGLFILYLSPYYFFGLGAGERSKLSLGSFPVDVQTVMCGFIALRVIIEILYKPSTFKSKIPTSLLYMWLLCFIPVLIGFYLGFISGNPNWTRGLRWLMISGSYFYGYILLRSIPLNFNHSGVKFLNVTIIPMSVVMLFLMLTNIYWSHHGFLFLGIGGAFSIHYMRNSSFLYFFLGFFLFFMIWKLALSGTITMMGIVLVSILFSLVGSVKKVSIGSFGKIFSLYGGAIILSLVLLFTAGVLYSGLKMIQQNEEINIQVKNTNEGFEARLKNKILADRLPFWYAAFEQIISGPYIIVPSGRPLKIIGIQADWIVGAHNTILEMLRLNGLVAGSFILYIYFFGLRNLLVVLGNSNIRFLRTLAAGILSVVLVGMTTGDFPADFTVGFWIWSIAGLVNGLYSRENQRLSYI